MTRWWKRRKPPRCSRCERPRLVEITLDGELFKLCRACAEETISYCSREGHPISEIIATSLRIAIRNADAARKEPK